MIRETEIYHIYRDGSIYDLLWVEPRTDLEFWLNQAKEHGDPVLELACGTGRVATELAGQGLRVTGLDNSPAMLDAARRKSAAKNVVVQWVAADMRDFELAELFRLIILPNNTICHLLSLQDFEACLSCVKKHLAPRGRFVVDVFSPKMEKLLEVPGERSLFAEYDDPDRRGRVVITETYVYEPDTQIKRITTHHAVPGQQETEGKLDMRMYFPQELDALMKYNGFAIDAKYGTYDRTPFDSQSEKQLMVCSAS